MSRVSAASRSHNKGKGPKDHAMQMWSAFSIVFPHIDMYVLRNVLSNLPVLCNNGVLTLLEQRAVCAQRHSTELISLACSTSTGVDQLFREMAVYDLKPDTLTHLISKVKALGDRAGKIVPGELSSLISQLNNAGDAKNDIIAMSTSLVDMKGRVTLHFAGRSAV